MAEFLPTIRENQHQHRHQEQQQQQQQPNQNLNQSQIQSQNQNQSKQQAKQTIERDTNSFQVSSASASITFPEGDDKTADTNSSVKSTKTTLCALKRREREPLVVGACGGGCGGSGGSVVGVVVGSGIISNEEKQTKSSFVNDKAQFIDSRSILSNKAKLKRFWENKMEMEFKLRQQQQSALRANKQQQPLNGHQKVVELDENNNRGSNNKHNNNNNNGAGDIDGNQQQQQQQHQQQVQCASDEEWRSLSPNVEPTTLNGPFNKSFTNVATKQVSAELVCEKLRKYQASNGKLGDKRPTTNGHNELSSAGQMQDAFMGTINESAIANGLSKQVPNRINSNNDNNNIDNNNTNKNSDDNLINSNCGHDETQLMSIDPTLCHSRGNESQKESKTNDDSYKFININSTNLAACSSLAEDLATTYNKHREEEQTVNEEFSSSSNSSFGPMSISLPREESLAKAGEPALENEANSSNVVAKQQINNSISDEDDLSSAQSGSVLTVINKFDTTEQKNQVSSSSILDDKDRAVVLSDLRKSSPKFSNNVNSIQSEQVTNSSSFTMPNLMVSGSENNNNNNDVINPDDEDDPDGSGSDIGVTFESLQFDNEIKSSKQEEVDDELLIAPMPVKRPALPKFNANEVKSVCHFITNAITDATRQVESYITGQGNSSTQQRTTDNNDMGSIQRATFIPHQSDISDESMVVDSKNIDSTTNYVLTTNNDNSTLR